jgi:hypothetical protein
MNQEEQRDYLDEARRLMAGNSLLIPERAHLLALREHYESSEYATELLTNYLSAEAAGMDWQKDAL